MSMTCLLVPTGAGLDPRHRLDTALTLAGPLNAEINLDFVSPDPSEILSAMPDAVMAGGLTLDSLLEQNRAASATAHAEFQAWCRTAGIADAPRGDHTPHATTAFYTEHTGSIESVVALTGRLSDLIVVDRPSGSDAFAARAFDAAVFATGRPTLVVPPGRPSPDLLSRIAIAWNGSVESARAVGLAIDLLKSAKEVLIFTANDPSGSSGADGAGDLVHYLKRHGVAAFALTPPAGAGPIGEALLDSCRAAGATMIVMGAYTHSRVRQMFLGGVTRHVLHHAEVPLLMAH